MRADSRWSFLGRTLSSIVLLPAVLGTGCKSPPTAAITVQSPNVAVGAVVALGADQSVDASGESLAYAWRLDTIPAGSRATIVAADQVHAWFMPDVAGSYTVELKVNDNDIASAPATTMLTAGPCGSNAPTVSAIAASPAVPGIGGPVALSAMVSDADNQGPCNLNQQLGYHWSLVSMPAGAAAQLNGAALLSPSFTPQVAGTYVVGLVVTDSTALSSPLLTQSITVGPAPVCGQNPPVAKLAAGNPVAANCQTQTGGGMNCTVAPVLSGAVPTYTVTAIPNLTNGRFDLQLDGSGSFDPDNQAPCSLGQPLSYKWEVLAAPISGSWSWQPNGGGGGGGTSTTQSTLINPTIRLQAPGQYQLRLTVSDGTLSSAPILIQVQTS